MSGGTGTTGLAQAAEDAHREWSLHWASCWIRTNNLDYWCKTCDDLDLAANRAEHALAQARAERAVGAGR
jgi:hypothetical protein